MAEGILSYGDAGRDVGAYDTATDSPMTLVGEGAVGDAMVITSGTNVRPQTPGSGGSVGDVSREGVTIDNRIARWHGTGAEVQSSVVSINDDGDISGYGTLTGGDLNTQLVDTDGLLRILAIGQNGAADRQAMLWDDGGGTWIVDDILEPGAGTLNRMPLWTPDANHLGNSDMSDDGSTTTVLTNDFVVAVGNVKITAGHLGVGVTPAADLHVNMDATADLTTLAGSLFLEAFNNDGAGNFGASILFGQPNGGVIANRGASIVAVQGAASGATVGLDFNVHGFGTGDPRFKALGISHLGDVDVTVGDVDVTLGDVNVIAGLVKIGNATTSTPLTSADDLVIDRGAIASGFTIVSTTTMMIAAADAAANDAGTLTYVHSGDLWQFGIGGTKELEISDGTVTVDVKGKSGRSDIGGSLVKLTNKTGGDTIKGQLVETSATTAEAFDTAGSNSADVIGIVLEAGVADGEEAWIVEGGIAEVLVDTGGAALHDRLITSATVGRATVSNNPSNTNHFREIGHVLETVGGLALAKTVLHFN